MPEPIRPDEEGRAPLAAEDFRSVRRWLVVLGAIAVVAVGVAIFSLVRAQESEQEKADRDRVVVLERQLRQRIAELDRRLGRTSEEADVRRLERRSAEEGDVASVDRRLRRVEEDVTDAADTAASTGRTFNRVERRVDALARAVRALRRR